MKILNYLPTMIITLLAVILYATINNLAFAANGEQNSDLWYIGKAASQNMYVKYKIEDNGTNNGNPYEMTIYFKEHDPDKQYWNATISVAYHGKIVTDTFHLADDNLRILSDSNVSDAMKPYVVSYSRTLDSLTIVATEPGKPLSAPGWCAIGGFSGCLYQVSSNVENVNVTAGTFPCKVLTDRRYETYVNQDTPYPVKRIIGVGGMATISRVPFSEYELLEIGQGYEKVPEFPFAISILLVGVMSILVFYRTKPSFRI